MAKGQMRSNKEKKKPKAAHNVKGKGATTVSAVAQAQPKSSANPFQKKG
jgi:hypothetical protein